MTNTDTAFEIAKRLLELESEIHAQRDALNYYSKGDPRAEKLVQENLNRILAHENFRLRSDEIEHAIHATNGDDSLIRTLHAEIVQRMTVE